MQDKILELLGESLDAASRIEGLANKAAPILSQIQQHSDKVNPELMAMYKSEMAKLEKMKQELKIEKENIQNFDK